MRSPVVRSKAGGQDADPPDALDVAASAKSVMKGRWKGYTDYEHARERVSPEMRGMGGHAHVF